MYHAERSIFQLVEFKAFAFGLWVMLSDWNMNISSQFKTRKYFQRFSGNVLR